MIVAGVLVLAVLIGLWQVRRSRRKVAQRPEPAQLSVLAPEHPGQGLRYRYRGSRGLM